MLGKLEPTVTLSDSVVVLGVRCFSFPTATTVATDCGAQRSRHRLTKGRTVRRCLYGRGTANGTGRRKVVAHQ